MTANTQTPGRIGFRVSLVQGIQTPEKNLEGSFSEWMFQKEICRSRKIRILK